MQNNASSVPALSETPWFFALGCCSPGKYGLCAQQPAPPGFSTVFVSVTDRLTLTFHQAHLVDLLSGHE